MPIPSTIADISTTAGSNSPGGSETPGQGDDHIRAAYSFIAQLRDQLDGTSSGVTLNAPNLGIPTSSTQPAFHAYRNNSDQTSGTKAIFPSELFDQGSGYDASTGIFTAPAAGIYVLCANVYLSASSSIAEALEMIGSTAGIICSKPVVLSTSESLAVGMSCVAALAALETVYIQRSGGTAFSAGSLRVEGTLTSRNNSFSGARLY